MGWETLAYHKDKWQKLQDDANIGRLKRYSFEILHLCASLLTISVFVIMALKSPSPEIWYVIILLFYLAIAIILLAFESFRFTRKSRYAEAIKMFHPIAHILRDTTYNIQEISESDFEHVLRAVLANLASSMSMVTGTKVRACIKLLRVDGGISTLENVEESKRKDLIFAETYVCDPQSNWPEKNYKEYPYDKDRLSCNSAFCKIFSGDVDYYLENNIPRAYKYHKYENSSFHTYGIDTPGKPGWVLPYRSTIIWPIRKLVGPKEDKARRETLAEKHDVLGFLCIDSASRNVWSSRFDGQIGAACADFLYAFMNLWFEKHLDHHPADSEE